MKKIVITGAPGSGKTTIIEELGKRGYCILPEAAIEVVKERKDALKHESFEEFNKKIFEKQKALERELRKDKLVVLDRGFIDSIAYYNANGLSPPKEILDSAKKANYSKAIVLEMLPENHWNEIEPWRPRVFSYERGQKIGGLVIEAYKKFGIPITIIPVMPIQERTKKVIEEINKVDG